MLFTCGSGICLASGAVVALVQCCCADTAMGTLGTAHGAAGVAALPSGGEFAGVSTGAGSTSGTGAAGVHFKPR